MSRLSQPPLLQLEVYRSPSHHPQSLTPLEMESFVEKCSHATSLHLTTSKQTSITKRARFEAGPSVLRSQTALAFTEGRPDVVALAGPSGLVASWTFSCRSFEMYSREGIASVVPSNILVRILLTLSLQSFITALEAGDLNQVNKLRGATDLILDGDQMGCLQNGWVRCLRVQDCF